jgi:hypothetical protein
VTPQNAHAIRYAALEFMEAIINNMPDVQCRMEALRHLLTVFRILGLETGDIPEPSNIGLPSFGSLEDVDWAGVMQLKEKPPTVPESKRETLRREVLDLLGKV